MQTVPHPSPLALEAELCERVASAKRRDVLAPVLVVVPNRRVAHHVARRLVERFGAVLGVDILHHAALARRVLETAGVACPRLIGDALIERVTSSVLRNAPSGPIRDFVLGQPAAAGAIRGTLTDLREAGVDPAAGALPGAQAELGAIYASWTETFATLSRRGASDHTGLAVAATAHATAFAGRYAAILHHGAYELIGVHEDLVAALDRGREVVFLQPARRDAGAEPLKAEISFFDAQGASAELETAARSALAAVRAGVPPHETAVVVRSFGPYAAAMDGLVDAGDLSWHTSYARPLRRSPAVAAAVRAMEAAPGDDATFGRHADALEAIAIETVGAPAWEGPEGRALATLIASAREIETLLDERVEVPRAQAVAWLVAQVDAARSAPDGADGGGIRILDAMQARGLTFRHVALAGMNAGVFPRVGREDPFLPDAARTRVAAATGRPLRPSSARAAEEHLILSMVVGSARDRLVVSWRRADESGRFAVPSLALRDVALAAGIDGGAKAVMERAVKLPAHPLARLRSWAKSPAILRADEETLLAALTSESGAAGAEAVVRRRPDLTRGVALVGATDAFAPGAGAYDGRVGPMAARTELAATAIDRLGACPLQFFFRDVLHVKAPPEPPTPFEADHAAVGSRIHAVLQSVYASLLAERAFERATLAARIGRAKELLRAAWTAAATAQDLERSARWPLLERIETERWFETLDGFLAADLARMEDEGVALAAVEQEIVAPAPGGPSGSMVRARFDRLTRGGDGEVVGDYKTGGDLAGRLGAAEILSGAKLQVPLYALLAGAPVELLGVGPAHVPEPGAERDPRFVRFDGFKTPDQRAGFVETLDVLWGTVRAGRFPLRSGRHCEHCDYAAACRKQHPPTEFRDAAAADVADLRDCWEKKAGMPTLALVRAARPE